jgi:hypothetical protein
MTFAEDYERWFIAKDRDDIALESKLMATYQTAWLSTSADDRYAVISFVFNRRGSTDLSILLEALDDADDTLAYHATSLILYLVRDGFDLGPTTVDALSRFSIRNPEAAEFSKLALAYIQDGNDSRV